MSLLFPATHSFSTRLEDFLEWRYFVDWAWRHPAWRIGMLWQVSFWMTTWQQIITWPLPSSRRRAVDVNFTVMSRCIWSSATCHDLLIICTYIVDCKGVKKDRLNPQAIEFGWQNDTCKYDYFWSFLKPYHNGHNGHNATKPRSLKACLGRPRFAWPLMTGFPTTPVKQRQLFSSWLSLNERKGWWRHQTPRRKEMPHPMIFCSCGPHETMDMLCLLHFRWLFQALLQRAARALCPRLPALLSAFQSEKAAPLICGAVMHSQSGSSELTHLVFAQSKEDQLIYKFHVVHVSNSPSQCRFIWALKAAMQCAASLCNYLLRFCAQSVLASQEFHVIRKICQNNSSIISFHSKYYHIISYTVLNNCQHDRTFGNPMAQNQSVLRNQVVSISCLCP